MATKFNLTAQLQLQAPRNTAQVVSQIQRQLAGINVPVNVTNAGTANQQLNQINNQTKKATTQAQRMGKAFGVAVRRFAAFSVASRGITLFTSSLASAVNESIEFQRELIKISQVTGKTVSELRGLTDTISNLSTSLGVSSKSLLSTGRILSQAGIQAKELEIALNALAKTTLAPTFDDITKTTEGAVAIIAQFKEGVGALERQLGSINAVAGQFAVESGDLISAVRRTGGVFKAAGGDLEELLALFTSVRATTRESSESIATGLRTIFTRIQRPKTIEFLRQYGVELTDLEGRFVGPYEAVRRLSLAFSELEEGDITFVKVAEELGGFRQIGKVIPLIKEFSIAEKARQAALEGGDSLTRDAASAQLALAVQITKVKEEFYELIRALTETSTFQALVKTSLNLASALIKVADAFKPLIPLLGAFAAFKVARGIGGFAAGIGAGLRGTKGFNSGGLVPGSGNRDTVPAMLTPGEFVIRKSSVKSLGAGNLAAMNAKGYSGGGGVKKAPVSKSTKADRLPSIFNSQRVVREKVNLVGRIKNPKVQFNRSDKLTSDITEETFPTKIPQGFRLAGQRLFPRMFEKLVSLRLTGGVKALGPPGNTSAIDLPLGGSDGLPTEIRRVKTKTSPSELIDKLIRSLSQQGVSNKGYQNSSNLTGKVDDLKLRPMKVAYGDDNRELTPSDAARIGLKRKVTPVRSNLKKPETRATGGGISGSDTVPALLTPGEFVINKKAASQIGAANLNRMNTKGVQGFARGGFVGIQRFANGTGPGGVAPSKGNDGGGGRLFGAMIALQIGLSMLTPTVDENSSAFKKLSAGLITTVGQIALFGTMLASILPTRAIGGLLTGATTVGAGFNATQVAMASSIYGGVKGAGSAVSGLAPKLNTIPRVGSGLGGAATAAGGAISAAAGPLAQGLTIAATAATQFAVAGGVAIGATYLLSKAMDTLTGVHERAIQTIERGNVAEAGQAAVNSRLQKDANNLALSLAATGAAAGAAAGLLGGPFAAITVPVGTALGALAGGLTGILTKLPGVNKLFEKLRDSSLGDFFGLESTSLIADRAKVEALATKNQKEFADNARDAARAMEDVESGALTFRGAFESGELTRNLQNQGSLAVSNRDIAVRAASESLSPFSATVSSFTGGLFGTSSEQQLKDLFSSTAEAEETKRKELNKVIDENRSILDRYGRDLLAAGQTDSGEAATLETFRQKTAESLGVSVNELPAKALADLEAKFVRNAKEIAANTRAFAESTVGVQGLSNYANGASAEIGKISSVLNGSFNSVKSSSDLLAASLSGAQVSDESFNNALDNLTAGFEDFGIDNKSTDKIRRNVSALRSVTGDFNSAIADVANDINNNADLKNTDFKEVLLDKLAEGLPDDQQDFVKNFFGGIEFDPKDIEKSLAGDFSGILKTLGDEAGAGFKEVQEASEAVSNAQQALVDITRQRIQVERQFIEAQKENIGLQEEAAKALSDFGIDTLDTSEKVEFAQKKLAASFDGRTFGGAGDIQNEIRSIQARATGAIQQNRGALTGVGPQGTQFAANVDLIAKSQDQLNATIEYSRKRIELYKEELDIVRKKNEAEKSSLESLLSGDIEAFIQGQQRAGAAAALRSGDASLASLFGSKALGGALSDLREQGVSGEELERASSIALRSVGIVDQSSAQVLAGTTDEERAIMAGVQAEAESLRAAGAAKEALAGEQLTTAKLGETQATQALTTAQQEAAKAAEKFAAAMDIAAKKADEREKRAQQIEAENTDRIRERQVEERVLPATQAAESIAAARAGRAQDTILDVGSNFALGGPILGSMFAAIGIARRAYAEPQIRQQENEQFQKALEAGDDEELKKRQQRELERASQRYRKGGVVYAKNGLYAGAYNIFKNIFRPKGVDSIPAMVQPGEFIVSKRGVQSGNNLDILKAMNQGMSGLGNLGFDNIGGMLKDGASMLMKPAESIMHAAEQLKNTFANTNIGMSVSPFNVNVNFNGASFLEGLTEDIKSKVMTEVVEEMKKMSFDNSGNSIRKKGVL
jgi:hypothetical protein